MEDKDKSISKIEKDKQSLLPSRITAIRAAISTIPWIGSALDHLIFDKADEFRTKNIEKAINEIESKISKLGEDKINKGWFKSEEALQLFKNLIDKIQFEPSTDKISFLSGIYAVSGSNRFVDDPNKFAVLQAAAQMTNVQKEILLILATLNPEKRVFSSGSITSSGIGIWFDTITESINKNPKGKFWSGDLNIRYELEILETLNLLQRINVLQSNILAYRRTVLGIRLIEYLIKE